MPRTLQQVYSLVFKVVCHLPDGYVEIVSGVWYVCNMTKKKKDENNYTYDLNAIFGKGSEEKRMADKVLDRIGVPNDYKHQYVAEKNMKAKSADKKAKKIGEVPTWLVDRAYPKLPKESELSYLKRGLMNSGIGGVVNMGKSVGKGLSKIQNKAYKKKKK
jgi:hypothetical protein